MEFTIKQVAEILEGTVDGNPDEKVWNHLKNEDLKAHQATNVKELKTLTRTIRKNWHLRTVSRNTLVPVYSLSTT